MPSPFNHQRALSLQEVARPETIAMMGTEPDPTQQDKWHEPCGTRDHTVHLMQLTSHQMPNPATNLTLDLHQAIEQAIEQASAPNLTQSERLQKLLESISAPILQVEKRDSGAFHDRDVQIVAIHEFQNSPEYANFKAVIQNTLQQLDVIANSSPRPGSQGNRFQNFGKDLFVQVTEDQRSRFGTAQADLFVQSCPDANRLLRMYTFAKQRPDLVASGGAENTRASITELSQRLGMCGPGIVQYFDEAVKTVRQLTFTPSMPERAEALRIQIVRNAIVEYLNRPEATNKIIGSEVHTVAAWQNHFSRMFALPTISDVYANANITKDQNEQAELASKLSALQGGSFISTTLANQILEEAQEMWRHAQANGNNDLSQYCMTLLEKLKERHGPIQPHTVMLLDDDGMPSSIQDNPTLLALDIVGQADNATEVHLLKESVREWAPTHQNAHGKISLKSRGDLNWLETAPPPGSSEKPQQELVSMEPMSRQQVIEFLDALCTPQQQDLNVRQAMHGILQNDWGKSLPPVMAHKFTESNSRDVFVNLVIGIANGQKLGPLEPKAEFGKLMVQALEGFTESAALKKYSENEIFQLLEYTQQWNDTCYDLYDLVQLKPLCDSVNDYIKHPVHIPLYKAVHRYDWKHWHDFAYKRALTSPPFFYPNYYRTGYGEAFIEAIASEAPQHLKEIAGLHMKKMENVYLFFKFVDLAGTVDIFATKQKPSGVRNLIRACYLDQTALFLVKGLHDRGFSLKSACNRSFYATLSGGKRSTLSYLKKNIDIPFTKRILKWVRNKSHAPSPQRGSAPA